MNWNHTKYEDLSDPACLIAHFNQLDQNDACVLYKTASDAQAVLFDGLYALSALYQAQKEHKNISFHHEQQLLQMAPTLARLLDGISNCAHNIMTEHLQNK